MAAPEAPAIIHQAPGEEIKSMSYGELDALSSRVAGAIRKRGIEPGAGVAILMPMTADAVAIYLGIVKAGCAVIGIADSFAPPEIATRLRLGKASLVFTQDVLLRDGKRLPLYARLLAVDPPPSIVLPAEGGIRAELRGGDETWHDLFRPRCSDGGGGVWPG